MDCTPSLNFKTSMEELNSKGYSAIDLSRLIPNALGEPLYSAMDKKNFHPNKESYYNEIAFYFSDDWTDVDGGLKTFHDAATLAFIYNSEEALNLVDQELGTEFSLAILDLCQTVKESVTKHHCGLNNNELKLSRCMVRQMNEGHHTSHQGAKFHEDQGYQGRAYRQMVSAVLTAYGAPTISEKYNAKIGELLIFNAKDRRLELGLGDEMAFMHRGPTSGPKLLFFFEFLGESPTLEAH